jgi:hypothetical protein
MGFYDEMEEVVNELLQEFGQIIPITHIPQSFTYDPATSSTQDPLSEFPEPVETQYGVVLEWDPNGMVRGGEAEHLGTLIEKADKRLIIAARALTSLSINDTIVANGISYTVKAPLKEINPANHILAYDCNLRR